MLRKNDWKISTGPMVSDYGIQLNKEQYQKIKSRLERLMDKCPINSSCKLHFKKYQTNYIGEIKIQSYSKNFHAKRVAHTPFQAFLLLEKQIDEQLLKWKRERFSESLAKSLSGPQVA